MTDDVRRKRAERVRQQRMKNFVPKYRNYILVGIVVLVLVAAAVALAPTLPAAKKFAHVHPSMGVFINGELVSFADCEYDLNRIGATESHFHCNERGAGHVMHIEANFVGGIPDISLERFFTAHGVTMRDGYVKLDTKDGHNGTEWPDQGDARWRMYLSKVTVDGRGPYLPVDDYVSYEPQDLDKIHITYGTDAFLTEQELQRQRAMIPDPPGEPPAAMPSP